MKIYTRKQTIEFYISSDASIVRVFEELYVFTTQGFSVTVDMNNYSLYYIDEDFREYTVWTTVKERQYIFDKIAEIE